MESNQELNELAGHGHIMEESLASQRWNQEYAAGRYVGESPIKFVGRIKEILGEEHGDMVQNNAGLYVGCGNGRNYIPLANSGLDIFGIDISQTAIDTLSKKAPSLAGNLRCVDFLDFDPARQFDYVISIQVFQHGDETIIRKYFDRVSKLLRRGCLLFLRVNSSSTEVYLRHKVTERNSHGGFTVRYEEGPKKGLDIHFFSRSELCDILSKDFQYVSEPVKVVTSRIGPKTGTWSQLELVARRR